MAKKICKICGKDGYLFYPYCYEHLPKKENETNETKINNIDNQNHNATNCLICGNKTNNGFLFCKEHYKEYKDKSILLKITNCTEIEFVSLIDKYESGLIYVCKDGHRVRSKSEVAIDNYLYDHNIKHAYEKAYPINNNKEDDLHPDFYLSDLDIYIEHWGYSNKANYKEEKDYKTKIYNKNQTTVIGTTEEDIQDIETSLNRKLKYYEKGKVN